MNKKNQNQNVAKLHVNQTRSTVMTPVCNPDKGNPGGMSLKQLNEYIVNRSAVIREYVREKWTGFHTSDIMPPICHADAPLNKNIDSVLASFSSTLAAALFSEKQYIKIHKDFEILSSIVESEQTLIFGFLSKNGLSEKFNEFVNLNKKNLTKK